MSSRKTAEGLCALSHQAMREELVCVHALVRGLAEIRVNKQHIVTPPPTLTLPGSGKAQGAETENILVCSAVGPPSERDAETPVQVCRDLVSCG